MYKPVHAPEKTGAAADLQFPFLLFRHFFLFDLMVDHMAAGQLSVDILQVDAGLDHQHHHMVGKVGDLINMKALPCLSKKTERTKRQGTSLALSSVWDFLG